MKNIYEAVLRRIKNKFNRYLILHNVYNTHNEKKGLIMYIVNPFFNNVRTHTNQQIAIEIAEVLKNNGYDVDVVQYNTKRKINLKRYQLIFGFGTQLDEFLVNDFEYILKNNIITIGFLTGASPYYSNLAELERLDYFKRRNGVSLELRRQVRTTDGLMNLQALQNMSASICTGNDWTVETWNKMIDKVYKITATGFDYVTLPDIQRNIDEARKNFFWFSGAGMLHKGLDLCIEAFREQPELHLYIAGVVDSDFEKFYQKDLERENIHNCGFLNVKSDEYKEICKTCLFSILPSCSEGGATSVLTTMFSGMIPVVTKEASVDIQDWGIEIKEVKVEYIRQLIERLSKLSSAELRWKERRAYEYAVQNHTIEKFSNDLNTIIESIIV